MFVRFFFVGKIFKFLTAGRKTDECESLWGCCGAVGSLFSNAPAQAAQLAKTGRRAGRTPATCIFCM